MTDEPVTIVDREVLKVLSTDTRMDILKMLKEGDRTPSFLGKKLNKKSSTIVEHLDVLKKVGLVKKLESPGKKWVFYSLTDRGQGIVSSKSRRLVIILATSLFALISSIGSFGIHLFTQSSVQMSKGMETFGADEVARAPSVVNVTTTTIKKFITQPIQLSYLYLGMLLLVIAALGFAFYFYKRLRPSEVKI